MAFADMTPKLPAAVSKAGNVGSMANVGFFPPALHQQMVSGIRAIKCKPLIIMHHLLCRASQQLHSGSAEAFGFISLGRTQT